MCPSLLCWPMMSEVDVGGMAVEVNLPDTIPLHVVAMWQMAADEQSDTMADDRKGCVKQRCVIEFLHAEKMAPIDIHWCLLNVSGAQTVDVSTLRQRVVYFSGGDRDSGSSLLLRLFTSTIYRLLFITGENAYEKVFYNWEFLLYPICCSLYGN